MPEMWSLKVTTGPIASEPEFRIGPAPPRGPAHRDAAGCCRNSRRPAETLRSHGPPLGSNQNSEQQIPSSSRNEMRSSPTTPDWAIAATICIAQSSDSAGRPSGRTSNGVRPKPYRSAEAPVSRTGRPVSCLGMSACGLRRRGLATPADECDRLGPHRRPDCRTWPPAHPTADHRTRIGMGDEFRGPALEERDVTVSSSDARPVRVRPFVASSTPCPRAEYRVRRSTARRRRTDVRARGTSVETGTARSPAHPWGCPRPGARRRAS
jgi:hypothetical protein